MCAQIVGFHWGVAGPGAMSVAEPPRRVQISESLFIGRSDEGLRGCGVRPRRVDRWAWSPV